LTILYVTSNELFIYYDINELHGGIRGTHT